MRKPGDLRLLKGSTARIRVQLENRISDLEKRAAGHANMK